MFILFHFRLTQGQKNPTGKVPVFVVVAEEARNM